jgi:hypothetical protein
MDEKIKINIKIQNRGNLLANANISLLTDSYGWITIKGFQVWKSDILNIRLNEKINIKPTSQRSAFGKYLIIVFIEEQIYWEKMEKEIYKAYVDKQKDDLPVEDIVIPDDF